MKRSPEPLQETMGRVGGRATEVSAPEIHCRQHDGRCIDRRYDPKQTYSCALHGCTIGEGHDGCPNDD